jgi:hypothetical protein
MMLIGVVGEYCTLCKLRMCCSSLMLITNLTVPILFMIASTPDAVFTVYMHGHMLMNRSDLVSHTTSTLLCCFATFDFCLLLDASLSVYKGVDEEPSLSNPIFIKDILVVDGYLYCPGVSLSLHHLHLHYLSRLD